MLIGYYIRTKVTDAPIFLEAQQQTRQAKDRSLGAVEVFKRYPRGVFTAMGLRLGENTMYYLVVTFSITYLKVHVHANTKAILRWLLVAHAVHFVVIPLAGHLSDRFGRRPIYFVGAVGGCAWGFFAFPMMDSGHNAIIMSAVIIGLVFHGCMYAPQPAAMAEMFPTRMRYSGVSLGYQVTSIVAGSLAPIIAVRLFETYKSAVPIGWYLAATAAVTAVAVLASRETKGVDLAAVDLADAQRLTGVAQTVAGPPQTNGPALPSARDVCQSIMVAMCPWRLGRQPAAALAEVPSVQPESRRDRSKSSDSAVADSEYRAPYGTACGFSAATRATSLATSAKRTATSRL